MFGSPMVRYVMIVGVLALLLAGCELRRDGGDGADAEPVGDLSPTLAPLGADSSDLSGAAPPTVIIVDPTATASTLEEGAAQSESTEPTSQPAVDLSSESSSAEGSNQLESEQAAAEPESFVLPEDEVAVLDESAAAESSTQEEVATAEETTAQDLTVEQAALEEPVIANAPEDDLPTGGPIAANPPASDTVGSYAAPADGTYVVQRGDTLFSISQRYGTTVQALIAANGLTSDVIQEGQVLAIVEGYDSGYSQPTYAPNNYAPPAGQNAVPGNAMPGIEGNHVVAQGETLFSIAQRYGVSVEAMASVNGIPAPYTIYPGQILRVVSGAPNNFGQPNPYNNPNYNSYGQQPDNFGQPNPYNNPNYNAYGQQPGNSGYGQMEENIYGPPTYQQPGNNMPYSDPYAQPGYGNPGSGATHVVAAGETLFSIAQLYGLSADSIAAANGISNPNQIAAGQTLYLPY